MTYVLIFLGSYAAALVFWLLRFSRETRAREDDMRANGIEEAVIEKMRLHYASFGVLQLAVYTFFFGSFIGALASLACFVLS